jgi:hypothetical protein
MDIDNIFSKIEGNADKLGALLGFFGGASNFAKPWGTDTMSMLQKNITDLLSQPHIPDLGHMLHDMTAGYTKQTLFAAITAWIGGYALKEVDMDPQITKMGNALSKAGFGAILGLLAYNAMAYSGSWHSDGGADGSSGGGSHVGYLKDGRGWAGHFTQPTVAPTRNIGRIERGVPTPS